MNAGRAGLQLDPVLPALLQDFRLLQETIERIINEGCNGLICIIL